MLSNKKLSPPINALNRLYAFASKLEDQPDYAHVTFTATPYGQLTLSEFSQLLVRDLIESIEKKLERPTPALLNEHHARPIPLPD